MPIDNLSNRVRIPRLGKIHLGVKATTDKDGRTVEYPKAVDYFVVPDEVKAVYGEKPKELDIMFPVEDPDQFAPQFLRAYSTTQGLVCIGDGIKARRKIDSATGAIASSKTVNWVWKERPCDPQECPEYSTKRCRRVLNLLFLLPKVPGLGAWQIDTSSYNSIININSMVRMLKGMMGRCSMMPLTLILRPQEVSPSGMKKKTVYVLDIKQDIRLADLAQKAQLTPVEVLLPEVIEEVPEDLYIAGKADEAEQQVVEKPSPEEAPTEVPPLEEEVPSPEPPDKDTKEKLIQRIHIEANKIFEGYYENVIRPRIKATFEVDSSRELNESQLNTVLDWMIAKASEQDKRAFVLKMQNLGCKTKEEVLQKMKEATGGKDRGWTCGDLDKTLLLAQETKEQPVEGDQEVKDFLESESEKLL